MFSSVFTPSEISPPHPDGVGSTDDTLVNLHCSPFVTGEGSSYDSFQLSRHSLGPSPTFVTPSPSPVPADVLDVGVVRFGGAPLFPKFDFGDSELVSQTPLLQSPQSPFTQTRWCTQTRNLVDARMSSLHDSLPPKPSFGLGPLVNATPPPVFGFGDWKAPLSPLSLTLTPQRMKRPLNNDATPSKSRRRSV